MTVKVSKPAINVREELADLRKPTGVAGEAMLRAETPQEQFNLIGAGRRNLIINGNFSVAQRGTSKAGGFSQTLKYLLDRWSTYRGSYNPNITVSQEAITDIAGSQYCIRVGRTSGTSSTTPIELGQQIEERDVIPLRGKTVTASFYVRSGAGYTDADVQVKLFTTTGGDASTSGNSSGTVSTLSEDHMVNTSWKKIVVSKLIPNDAESLSLAIRYQSPSATTAGSDDYFEVAQVQLELGKVATPFEHRSYGEELALCQRYYYRYGGNGRENLIGGSNSSGGFFTIQFPTTMRAAPSFSNGGGFIVNNFSAGGTPSDINGGLTSVNSAEFQTVGGVAYTLGNSLLIYETSSNSGNLKFDAEL